MSFVTKQSAKPSNQDYTTQTPLEPLELLSINHHHHHVPCHTQSVGAAKSVTKLQSWTGRHSDTGSQGRNLEFVHGAGESSPILRKGHSEIVIVHQLMPADRTPSLMSIRGTAHMSMNHPACETLG